MDLRLNEDQEMFKKVAADFVQAEAPTTMLTQQFLKKDTFLPDLYAKIAGLGWLGMLVPEQYGGAGLSYLDCGVVFEELGRAPVPGPVFSSGVLAAQIVLDGGSDAQKEELLPAICGGDAIIIPAIGDHGAHWGAETIATTCSQSGDTLTLQGIKRHVYDAEGATAFLCAVRDGGGGVSVVLVDRNAPGVTVTPHAGYMVSVSEVSFDGVQVPAGNLLGTAGAGWELLDKAAEWAIPILCAYKVGACQEVYEFTVQYTNERRAFGQLIGRFQRVQDHCVELSIHMDRARMATYETLWLLDEGLPAEAGIHESKAAASEGYHQACSYSHMVHAGPGTDYLHPLMVHSVLAHTLYQYLGTPDYHKRRMVDALYPRS